MAGVNEHYIPRLLLRGFLTDSPGKKTFRYDKFKSQELSIRRIASADFFYSEVEGNKDIDDKLTEFENEIGPSMAKWRDSEECILNPEEVSRFITLFHIRTKSIRDSFQMFITSIIDAVLKEFSNPRRLSMRLRKEINNSDSEFRRRVRGELLIRGIVGESARSMERIFVGEALRKIDSSVSDFQVSLPIFAHAMMQSASGVGAKAQIKALGLIEEESVRQQKLSSMNWKLLNLKERELILPDCVVVSTSKYSNGSPYLFWDKDISPIVMMPISKRNIIVGGDDSGYNYKKINRDLAKCSSDFFISASNNSEIRGNVAYIGDFLKSYSKKMEDMFFSEGFRG